MPTASYPSRPLRALAIGAVACLALAGCTAHMDMTLSEDGTYDVVVDMRDSTGTVLTEDTICEDYADPALVGASEGASVTSRPVGSAGSAGGTGCEVTITGVAVPDASTAPTDEGSTPLVVRDGDLYVVDLSALQGASWSGDGTGGSGQSLAGVVDARVSVRFPGAVVEADGGVVEGTTVTWTDADVLASGVRASGWAVPGQGLSAWDRYWGWVVGAFTLAGLGAAAAVWRRGARTQPARRTTAGTSSAEGSGKAARPRQAPRRVGRPTRRKGR